MGKSPFRKINLNNHLILMVAILIIAAVLKTCLLILDRVPFNSDEAVVALMARHILAGERPIFFYGQAYMGSLDGWLVALAFAIFRQHVWVIRLVQVILYLLTILSTVYIGKEFIGSWKIGLGAGLLLALPVVNVTLYTTASLGGYGEALLIGNCILVAGLMISRQIQNSSENKLNSSVLWFGFGILAGLGLWANGLTLIYTLPVGLTLLFLLIRNRAFVKNRLSILIGLVGFLAGSFPWFAYAIQNGFGALINELFGSAVSVESGSWLVRLGKHFVNLILLGGTVTFGLRPPWTIFWLALPLIPIVLFIWVAIFIGWGRLIQMSKEESKIIWWMLAGVCLTLTAGFLFTSFGADPSGRYFVPLAIPFSLAASAVIFELAKKIHWQYASFAILIIFNLTGTVQSAVKNPPGITTQFYAPAQIDQSRIAELITFLSDQGITRGYTNYWVSYPLAFLSQETIIFVPRLPYHTDLRYTARDDRYKPYQQIVAQSDQIAYITTKSPLLDDFLVNKFSEKAVTWHEKWIGDFHIFYNLSQPVRPDEIGLDTAAF